MCVFKFVMEYHFGNMIGMFCVDTQKSLRMTSIIEFNNQFYELLYFITISTINYYILSRNIESLYLSIFIWCHPSHAGYSDTWNRVEQSWNSLSVSRYKQLQLKIHIFFLKLPILKRSSRFSIHL